ncbi:hypothetical protein LCGC14_2678630, partial [marine sediment metagenome]
PTAPKDIERFPAYWSSREESEDTWLRVMLDAVANLSINFFMWEQHAWDRLVLWLSHENNDFYSLDLTLWGGSVRVVICMSPTADETYSVEAVAPTAAEAICIAVTRALASPEQLKEFGLEMRKPAGNKMPNFTKE